MSRTFIRLTTPLSMFLVGFSATLASAQGVLINIEPDAVVRLPRPHIIIRPRPEPQPAQTYKIKKLSVGADIEDQIAKVQVSQTFVNTGSRQMEVCFVFPLPYDGAIDRLTLMVDGKEYPAKLLDKEKARELYEEIVRKNKDPALLEWMGTGMFKTSVFPVPAGAERTVSLRYSQLLRKTQGLTDFIFPLSTAKYTSSAIEKIDFQVTIESSQDIKNVYSPTHTVDVKRPDDKHARVTMTEKNEIPSSDFRLFYDVGKKSVGANVISYRPDKDKDGYFLLLASPKIKSKNDERPKKTVVFAVDRSGSMSGKKIEQAKEGLKFVLNNLREGDLFNIVAYDSEIEKFRPELQRYDEDTRAAAIGFVEGLYAGGSTNINGALKTAMDQFQDSDRPSFLIFLTDGLPTTGETNEMKIVENTKDANEVRVRLFAFGVGYDVNSRLLDKLARVNFGNSEYVRPDEDIERAVSALYNRIGAPAMTDVQITFDVEGIKPEDGDAINRVYPKEVYDLFAGEQLVIVGRYKKPGDAKVVITGAVSGKKQKLDFAADLVKHSDDQSNAFVEKLWAVRRVGEIIDELDLKGKNEELIKELVDLSKRHGILTPYTSFLADENSNLDDVARNAREAGSRLDMLAENASGQSGFAQRAAKGAYQGAQSAPQAAAADSAGRAYFYDAAEGDKVVVDSVRNVGTKTFFRRNDQWVDSTLSDEEQKKAQNVKRFSREYFDLVDRYGKRIATYFAVDEPMMFEVDGQAYQLVD